MPAISGAALPTLRRRLRDIRDACCYKNPSHRKTQALGHSLSDKVVPMYLRNGDLRFEVRLDVDAYVVSEVAQIACSTLRVVTASRLPFSNEALLRAQQFEDGFYLLDRDEQTAVRFVPGLPPPALDIFVRNHKSGVPVVLSEENLAANSLRSWLVMPLDPAYRLLMNDALSDAGPEDEAFETASD
jgi:hypothetical protein